MLHQHSRTNQWKLEGLAQEHATYFSRRVFLSGMAGAVGLALIGCNAPGPPPAPEQSRISFVAYHNRTAAYHQQQITDLSRQGYRPISLSMYGDPEQPLYAAVWLKRDGNAWYTFHSVDTATYQQLYKTWTQRGYRPTILTATGLQKTAVFAGVFEQDSTPYLMKYHLATTLQLTLDTPIQEVLKLGTPDGRPPLDPHFNDILVWHLLSHAGGWNRRIAPDPLFNDAAIAQALHVPLPINKYQMTAYMTGQPLQFTPGTQAVYSNFGYSLLGQIVEKILGLD